MPLLLPLLFALQMTVPAPTPTPKVETLEAEVVSADSVNKTLTLKADTGNRTLKVSPEAFAILRTVKAGDRVWIRVADDTVTDIKPAEGPSEPPPQPWEGRSPPPG
jgi:hypothetical protein